jgi:fructan beta-fructosidase
MYQEKYRPQFHFSARQNWLNDPNGLVYYKGTYHLFFQHNPVGINWGNMTWGHAVSRDLVRWQQLDNTLEPDTLGTMFSGSAVVDWKNTSGFQQGSEKPIVLMYTAAGGTSPESEGQRFTQCLAFSTDGGSTWQKYDANPVLGCIRYGNRDPKVFWHTPSNQWIMSLYLDEHDFAIFSSQDLKTWHHLQTFTVPDSIECPDFFELPVDDEETERKWVFMVANGRYYIGSFDGYKFEPESDLLRGDWGANFFASQSYSDIPAADGRRIQIPWMREGEYPEMPFNQQMGFPCELGLRRTTGGLRLTRKPINEIENLYAKEHHWADRLVDSVTFHFDGPSCGLYDITARIDPGSAKSFDLVVCGELITYNAQDQSITCLGRTAPVEAIDGNIVLRLLVDRTSLEIFAADGLVSMSSCFLPKDETLAVSLTAHGGTARLINMQVRELLSAWPNQD